MEEMERRIGKEKEGKRKERKMEGSFMTFHGLLVVPTLHFLLETMSWHKNGQL